MRRAMLVLVLSAVSAPGQRLVQRPQPERLELRFVTVIEGQSLRATLLLPGTIEGTTNSQDVAIQVQDSETVAVTFTPQQLAAVEAAPQPFLFLPEIQADGETKRNLMVPLPNRLDLEARDTSLRGNEILLVERYVPEKYRARPVALTDRGRWTVTYKEQSFEVQAVEQLAGRLFVRLAGRPPNGIRLTVRFQGLDGENRQWSVATAGAPTYSEKDPAGNADVYLGFNFARSGFSTAEPTDSYGVRLFLRLVALTKTTSPWVRRWRPQVKMLANAPNQQDDENHFEAAVPYEIKFMLGLNGTPKFLESIALQVGPKLESTKGLRNPNGVLTAELHFLPRTQGPRFNGGWLRGISFDMDPLIGVEGGRNLNHSNGQLDGSALLRLKTGGWAQLRFEIERAWLREIALEAKYNYRRLFREELFTGSSKVKYPAGALTPAGGGDPVAFPGAELKESIVSSVQEGSRRHVDLALRFLFSNNWEVAATFVRGELPPNYQKVDKVQAGFAYRFNFF